MIARMSLSSAGHIYSVSYACYNLPSVYKTVRVNVIRAGLEPEYQCENDGGSAQKIKQHKLISPKT